AGAYFVAGVSGGNDDAVIRDTGPEHAPWRGLFGEDQPDFRTVACCLPVGRVMQAQDQVRSGLDKTRGSWAMNPRRASRRVPRYIFIGERALDGPVSIAGAALRTGARGWDERHAGRIFPQPLRFRPAHPHGYMMHHAAVSGPNFRGLYPFVFSEVGRQNNVGVLDRAGGRNFVSGGHLEDHIGLADVPAFHE